MFLLVAAAWALDPSLECEAMAVPADGARYATYGATEDVYATLLARAFAEFEEGCPATCEPSLYTACDHGAECLCYRDDCVTSTGTHVVVDYEWFFSGDSTRGELGGILVEPATGALHALELSTTYSDSWGPHLFEITHEWTAAWDGEVNDTLPGDEQVEAQYDWDDYGDSPGSYWLTAQESWRTSTCARETTADAHPPYYQTVTDEWTAWEIDVNGQHLSASIKEECSALRTVTLDGVTEHVRVDWTPAVDGDGDGADVLVDCDDADPARTPCALDIACDGIDQDCDGADESDGDRDYRDAVCAGGDDCDDTSADVYPGRAEIACDGIDQDCDGVDNTDIDGDGHDATCAGGDDCDDTRADVHPGGTEVPYDAIDQDCNGVDLRDLDGDGFVDGPDCDDSQSTIHPDADEAACDGVDQDCDGDDCPTPEQPAGGCGGGAAAALGLWVCAWRKGRASRGGHTWRRGLVR